MVRELARGPEMLIPGVHVKIVKPQSSRQSGRSQALAEQPKATGDVSSCLKETRRGELEEGSSDLFLWTPYHMHGYICVCTTTSVYYVGSEKQIFQGEKLCGILGQYRTRIHRRMTAKGVHFS